MLSPRAPRLVKSISAVVCAGALATAGVLAAAPTASAAASCSAFTSKIYDQTNPSTQAQALSIGVAGYVNFQAQGFTTNRPNAMSAAPKLGTGLKGVHRLYRASNKNYFYSADAAEITRAIKYSGYVDQGTAFYASGTSSSCLVPVSSFYKSAKHRFVTSASEAAALVKAGWRKEAVRFYLGKPTTSVFTVAVIPDTQGEVSLPNDYRVLSRSKWLVANKAGLDLRFVTHTGDVVNWDTDDSIQFIRARDQLAPLRGAIPYSLSPGNHDTAAVRNGGSAWDPPNTWKLVRDTTTFNKYLNRGTEAMAGQFEPYKVDNAYHAFTAGGRKWLVLNLELWPRKEALAWATRVVKANPTSNVMVVTHSFMQGDLSIYQRSDYGATSPQYMYDNLLKLHPNIKMVFSGHTGGGGFRDFPGADGGRIQSFLLNQPDNTKLGTNPVRIIEINTATNSVSAAVYSPDKNKLYPKFEVKSRSAGFVR